MRRFSLLLLLALALPGCRDRQMYSQPRANPLQPFPVPLTRLPPTNTVSRTDVVDVTTPFETGYSRAGTALTQLPVPLTRALLERGEDRYQVFCLPCHGFLGDGQGMVAQRGFPRPPSYHTDYLRKSPVGHFFDVTTHGFGRIPAYGDRIPAADRWAIAAYIRVLQRSQHASAKDMP